MEPSGFREIARSATVTYPIPFAFALLLAFATLLFGGTLLTTPPLTWVLAGVGGASFLLAAGLMVGCVVWKPQLLRSERQEIRNRMVDFIVDSDPGPDTVEMARLVLDDPGLTKSAATPSGRSGARDGKR